VSVDISAWEKTGAAEGRSGGCGYQISGTGFEARFLPFRWFRNGAKSEEPLIPLKRCRSTGSRTVPELVMCGGAYVEDIAPHITESREASLDRGGRPHLASVGSRCVVRLNASARAPT